MKIEVNVVFQADVPPDIDLGKLSMSIPLRDVRLTCPLNEPEMIVKLKGARITDYETTDVRGCEDSEEET